MTVVEGLSLAMPTNTDTANAAKAVHAAAACGMGIRGAGLVTGENRAEAWAMTGSGSVAAACCGCEGPGAMTPRGTPEVDDPNGRSI
jgi:hypothetical protein